MESCEDGSVDADHAEGPPSPSSSSSTSHVDTTTEEGDTSEIATDGKCAEIPAGTLTYDVTQLSRSVSLTVSGVDVSCLSAALQ